MTRRWVPFGLYAFALVHGGHVWGGDAEELDRLCAANTAAVESIRTLQCKVRIDSTAARSNIPSGEYWRDGDKQRLHFTHKGNFNQGVIGDGVVRYMVKQDVANEPAMRSHPEVRGFVDAGRWFWHGGVERYDGSSPFLFNPWFAALCTTTSSGGQNVKFAEFAHEFRAGLRSVRTAPAGGVTAEFQVAGTTCVVDLDPAANYMIRRWDGKSQSPNGYSSSAEVTAFKEGAPGVFFPEQVVRKRWKGDKPEPDEVFTFHDIVINKPIPTSIFNFKYRHGIKVTDRIEGKEYKVNEAGAAIGPKVSMSVAATPPVVPNDMGHEPSTETKEEPRRAGWWLLPASVTVLAVAGVLVLLQRRRAAAAA